ncbi:pilus assembly protein PilW [Pseudomonas sp. Leaf58]|uniref:PilW family protein n=1 Tax=Pseudomonas sp. Leaf58 TaxID=1736226 RepID=UPI0006FEA872|nr:prepilin-type N-terminal cleavage/methylation domain-containing protein [Pseudomonas sp. Leaf58]AYG43370.1 pilus assembly protein PilW [Pseudomonas sp. Leaf58]KQN66846.1 pilus assembly protein PilW [Pseudomonas sp. Leaf58]
MSRAQRGFGLLELMLALATGLMLLAAASQLFASAHQAWRLQSTSVRMQDEARLALLRMAQDIRMAGMFGCLRLQPADFRSTVAQQAFARPVDVGQSTLSLVVAELPGQVGAPDWFVQTDCLKKVVVEKVRNEGKLYPLAYPVSQYVYQLQGNTLKFKRGKSFQPLVENVREMHVERVQTSKGGRVDIALTLYEPFFKIEQHHALSVAIRNPVPAS